MNENPFAAPGEGVVEVEAAPVTGLLLSSALWVHVLLALTAFLGILALGLFAPVVFGIFDSVWLKATMVALGGSLLGLMVQSVLAIMGFRGGPSGAALARAVRSQSRCMAWLALTGLSGLGLCAALFGTMSL